MNSEIAELHRIHNLDIIYTYFIIVRRREICHELGVDGGTLLKFIYQINLD